MALDGLGRLFLWASNSPLAEGLTLFPAVRSLFLVCIRFLTCKVYQPFFLLFPRCALITVFFFCAFVSALRRREGPLRVFFNYLTPSFAGSPHDGYARSFRPFALSCPCIPMRFAQVLSQVSGFFRQRSFRPSPAITRLCSPFGFVRIRDRFSFSPRILTPRLAMKPLELASAFYTIR